jgi:asparagine synthase (glutamine-hydrolysing)
MACFLLHVTDDLRPGPTPALEAGHGRIARRGLREWTDLDGPGFRLRYYPKILDRRPQLARADDGEFAVATGTFIYGGDHGERALAALLAEFDPSWDCLTRATGQFALVVHKGGQLHVATDRGGFHHVYHDGDARILSNSFLAVCEAIPRCTPVAANIHERVVGGAIHGPETVFAEVRRIPHDTAYRLLPEARRVAKPALPTVSPAAVSRDDMLAICAEALVDSLRPVARLWPQNMIVPLTGGYDSRLLTAAIRRAGADPEHLIYGAATDPDVQISHLICQTRGWRLLHDDREQTPPPSVDEFPALVDRSLHFHDGRGIFGVLDDGSDIRSREERAAGGRLYVSGSGGGIFRESLEIGPRRCSAAHVIRARYERFDREILRGGLSWRDFIAHYAPPASQLENWQIHALFPRWRLRYWMSPDNQVNNVLAPALTPYTDPAVTELALGLPQEWRDDGLFEADLIATLDPELAAFPSAYGWRFTERPPLRSRLRRLAKQRVPGPLRQRWQHHVRRRRSRDATLPVWMGPEYERALFGTDPWLMDEFVAVDRIRTRNERNLVLSLELLLRTFS